MFHQVVVGVKSGQSPDELVDAARSVLAEGGRIHLVTFVRVRTEGDEVDRRARAERALADAAAGLRADGVDASTELGMIGVAAGHELTRVATEQDADLLVILTEWNEFRALDLQALAKGMATPRMADLRNIYTYEDALAAGFSDYESVGRGDPATA